MARYESIDKKLKRRIQIAFRDWQGRPTRQQRKLLKRHDLSYEHGSTHGKIVYDENPSWCISVSCTPSSHRAGRYVAKDLLGLLERVYAS